MKQKSASVSCFPALPERGSRFRRRGLGWNLHVLHLKVDHLGNRNPRLHTDEVLIALSICAATNPTAELAMEQLNKLRGCEVHSSVILSSVDEKVFRRLGVNITCEPIYETK